MKDYVAATWGWDDQFQARMFHQNFDPTTEQVVVAAGQDVGVLSVERRDTEIFLSHIEILPEFQGRGLGAAIINDILAEARGKGLPVSLRVLKVNPARRLYERLGFAVTGETPTHSMMKAV
jgi:GNAT superfamily N-acetyltransferase